MYYLVATHMGASEHSDAALQVTLRNNAVESLNQLGADGATPAVSGAMCAPARRAQRLQPMYRRALHRITTISSTTECYLGAQPSLPTCCMRGRQSSHKQADGWGAASQALNALVEGRRLEVWVAISRLRHKRGDDFGHCILVQAFQPGPCRAR